MKEAALQTARQGKSREEKLNILREYVQAYVLRILHDEGFFRWNAFIGGTALRFLYGLPRYSEDLDFSKSTSSPVSFSSLLKKVKEELTLAGYEADIQFNEEKTVQHAFIKCGSLLYEAGISPLKSQKLAVKMELDTRPPDGAELRTEIVTKYFPLSYLTYEIPSLFAGKVHALLSRKYTKGRDFFDAGWYLSRWKDLAPNMTLLRNALVQTGWQKEMPDENNWPALLKQVIEKADWKNVRQDVSSFLENPKDLDVLTQDNILTLLEQRIKPG